MFQKKKLSSSIGEQKGTSVMSRVAIAAAGALFSVSVMAQQSGSISGQVFLDEDVEASGVTVKATSNVMPRGRTATTDEDGEFKLPALIPGTYTLTFTAEDGTTRTVKANVLLDQTSTVSLVLASGPSVNSLEEVEVVGDQIIVGGEASLSNALGADVVQGVPVGQDYRDLMKLIPGVQFTQDAVRGPSAGGSGQDNRYAFDGVDVTLPLFGTLSAEPSTHDVEQVSVERGGANAVGFNRAGGFSVNSKTKSGTNEFKAGVEYKMQPKDLVADADDGTTFEEDQSWMTAYAGGPLIPEKLFYYASYYGPRVERSNPETAYGATKAYESVRDEYYGKLTYAPIDDVLLNIAYRTSDREEKGSSISFTEADSVSSGGESAQDIFTLDGSWLITPDTTLSFQYDTYSLEGRTLPDNVLGVQPVLGGTLDVANLDQMGYLSVPNSSGDDSVFDDRIQPLIDAYGYVNDEGMLVGGGGVGAYSGFEDNNFYRDSFEVALDHNIEWGSTSHDLHAGFRWSESKEEVQFLSNGWGAIDVYAGRTSDGDGNPVDYLAEDGTPIYYRARVESMSLSDGNGALTNMMINSYVESFNFELNDKIEHGDFTYNIGVLISQDVLYGQGLKENSSNYSGYELSPGTKYEMYSIDWEDMIQPRLGVTWNYNETADTLFANFAQYNPSASSLARAASWDRNIAETLYAYFDEEGNFISATPRDGSSGKAFQDGLTPRRIDEFTIGTTKGITDQLNLRAHVRYREGSHFWEDTPNGARLYDNAPADIMAKGEYVPDLDLIREEIGGSSYVIAELDDAYTEYWELSLEAEWYGERSYLNASYVRSRYTGNFDQDNTTATNDANTFIGSSWLADGYGRQVWDNRDGTLRGDRPHVFKVFGYYELDWKANVGAYFVYQSGQPWEAWDPQAFGLPSWYSTTSRFAEKAGSRRSPNHWQLDLNYTQNFQVLDDYTLKFRADLFNVFDRQTAYNFDPYVGDETFGEPRDFFDSRRIQLSLGVDF